MEDFNFEENQIITHKKKRGCAGPLAVAFVFILLVGVAIFWWKFYYTYSDGYRSGLLQKLSHKGNFAKTYEGELVMSSITSNNNVALASEKFYFSIANDSLAKALMNYEGKYMRLHYQEKKGTLPWRGESRYIVDDMKPEISPGSIR